MKNRVYIIVIGESFYSSSFYSFCEQTVYIIPEKTRDDIRIKRKL